MSGVGLSNLDIEKELRNVSGFHGCFVKDELKFPLKEGSYVVNLGSYGHGTHWVAIVKRGKNGEVYYYDSYGVLPFQEVVDWYPNYNYNEYQIQPLNTSFCGQICISFIRLMTHFSFPVAIEKLNQIWSRK